MFGCARDAGIDCVILRFCGVGDIARDHRALHKVNVFKAITNAGRVVQVLIGGFAVVAPLNVNHVDRRPRGAKVYAGAGEFQIM